MTEMSISREDKPEPLEPGKTYINTHALTDINKLTFDTRAKNRHTQVNAHTHRLLKANIAL